MTLVNFTTANLVGGISQQVDQLKLPGQVSDCVNMIPHPTDGLVRRNECRLEGITDTTVLPAGYVHWINRDANERYCVYVSDSSVRVFGLDGTEYLVRTPAGTAVADMTYLNIATAADAPEKYKALTVADYTFILNKEVQAVQDSVSVTASPTTGEGYLFFKQSNYSTLYTVTVKLAAGSDKTFKVYIGDGQSTGVNRRFFTITTLGAVGTTWTVTWSGGLTAVYTVVAGDTINSVHQKLSRAVDLDTNVGSASNAYGFEVYGNYDAGAVGSGIPTLVNSGAGVAESYEVFQTVGTDKLAANFAALIDADADLVATSKGSVCKITAAAAATEIVTLEANDPAGGTGIVSINRKVENVDDLPEYCTDGYIVKVTGNAADTEDDYYVRFDADETSDFGAGTWIETIAAGQLYKLDADTWPHQLLRQQNVALNTPVVGLAAGAIYFTFGPMELNDRTVGDNNVGLWPGIGDGYLNDIFFHRNRLGFLASQSVLLSEAGRYFNFWPTTVRQVVDSDPIGITAAHTKVAELYAATGFEDQLILWSDRTQFRLQGDPILTPKTASIQPISEFQNLPDCRPIGIGRTMMFANEANGWSRIYEYFSRGDGLRFDAADTTIAVPSLLRGDAKEIAVCPTETTVVVRTGTDSEIYLHRYLYEGDQKIQSAWTKLQFNVGKILGIEVFDTDLYMLVQSGAVSAICRLNLKASNVQEDLLIPHMDFLTTDTQIDPSDIVYDALTDTTDITLPWSPQTIINGSIDNKTYMMIDRSNVDVGQRVPILSTSLTTITVRGDWTPGPGVRFYVGSVNPASVTLPVIYLRTDRSGATYQVGNLRVRYGTLSFRNSGYYQVTVGYRGERDDSVATYSGYAVSDTVTDDVVLGSGEFRFPVHGLNDYTDITISTDAQLHVALVAIDWEAEYNARSTRFGR